MKKFLVFLVALIATVCIGVTFYQFAKNDEVISVGTAPIYINYGDKLSLDDIGFSRKEASKQTTFDFNAGGDDVTSIIKFDQATQCYVPTSKGGATTIKISTSNRKYKTLTIDVFVGVGSEENPYYISNEKQLFDVTNKHIAEEVNYKLVNNIELKEVHSPIGLIEDKNHEFNGTFDGGYNTISNLQIESCKFAGLFGIVGSKGSVNNLNIANAKLDGQFSSAGVVAGKCYGKIDKVIIDNPVINNTDNNGVTGGAVGTLETDTKSLNPASVFRTGVVVTKDDLVITASSTLGGLVGVSHGSQIHACYANVSLKNTSDKFTGGLVGEFVIDEMAKIYESYAISKIDAKATAGNIAGKVEIDSDVNLVNLDTDLILVGLYFNQSLNKYSGLGSDTYNIADATSFTVNGKTTDELLEKKTYIYYVTNNSNIVYWDKVWHCVDGQYPTLIFANKFEDVTLEDDGTVTNPDVEEPEITDPENSSSNTIIITNKNEFISRFQTGSKVSGKFIINADIDLGGMEWVPVDFTGTINGNNHTISNFTIIRYHDKEAVDYRGVFYRLSSSTIKNIKFSNVSFLDESAEGAGVVVGYISADVRLSNIKVENSDVAISARYGGGVVGVINGVSILENISAANTNVSALRAAGIAGRVSASATLDNCNVVTEATTIKGVDLAGGIAAVNYGTIQDSYVKGIISSYGSSKIGYIGGIVATNYKVLKNNSCWATIEATNTTNGSIYQVGGIAAINDGTIDYCNINTSKISAGNSTSKVYIGGLTSTNEGKIRYSVANVDNIGSLNTNLYVAGLAVVNFGGEIKGCFNFGNLSGYIVAGLVINNDNNATIDACMTGKSIDDGIIDETGEWEKRVQYKGHMVSTFAYSISSGTISNCLVSAKLLCQHNDGWVAGFAGFMPYTKGSKGQDAKYGTISSCIANISLLYNNLGDVYCDIASGDLMTKNRCTGTISNCVITTELSSRYHQSLPDKNWFTGKTYAPASESNFVARTVVEMTDIATFTQAGLLNFDISTQIYYDVFAESYDSAWVKPSQNRIPLPSTIFNVFGNIFGENSDNVSGDIYDDNAFVDKWLGW